MPETFSFQFNESAELTAVRISDGWARAIGLEKFGEAMLTQYLRAKATAQGQVRRRERAGRTTTAQQRSELVTARRELAAALRDYRPEIASDVEPADPVEVSDRKRFVVLQTVGGFLGSVVVDEPWLRRTDVSDVEAAVLEALQQLEALPREGDLPGHLENFRRRYLLAAGRGSN